MLLAAGSFPSRGIALFTDGSFPVTRVSAPLRVPVVHGFGRSRLLASVRLLSLSSEGCSCAAPSRPPWQGNLARLAPPLRSGREEPRSAPARPETHSDARSWADGVVDIKGACMSGAPGRCCRSVNRLCQPAQRIEAADVDDPQRPGASDSSPHFLPPTVIAAEGWLCP